MAPTIPKLLFRVWSDESNGTNTRSLFKPASQRDQETPHSIHDFGRRLQQALLWKDVENNPFIFFSSSLLFVLQLAGRMKSQGQQNIYITCVDTGTATTCNGSLVMFHPVNALLEQFGITITNRSDGSKRQYNHEYATLTSVVPAASSRCTSFETLLGTGLFDLYPHLRDVNMRHNVRLHLAVTDLREFGFSTEQALSREKIDTAARMAYSFRGCSTSEATAVGDDIELHLFAWFLSLRKRSKTDAVLKSWLDSHSALVLEDSVETVAAPITGIEDPEFMQYRETVQDLEGRSLLGSRISSASRISGDVVTRELATWQVWRREKRDMHRAGRPDRIERNRSELPGRKYGRRARPERTERVNSQYRRRRYDRSRSPRRDDRRAGRYERRREREW